ncbi:MAG TPA: glycosyltransferase [Chitinophagaceae bacterium]|nr:glycosyltransferase [Chitinophagaceae bacterium]
MIILYISLFLFACYTILIIYYWQSWISIPEYHSNQKPHSTKVSVIIPARNEEENILALLQALQIQTYPEDLFEIIVVNDHSDDNTSMIVKQFPRTILIDLEDDPINSYKKKAIEKGILAATGTLIITTDADCIPPIAWIETIVSFYEEKKSAFIAAPVVFNIDASLLEIFQALDFLVLQGITGASVSKKFHSMCNGANLAYEKEVFEKVNGFDGVDSIASGDDMLLMHKVSVKFPGKIHYLKSRQAIVATQPMKTLKKFFNQRIRWASKARFYNEKGVFGVLLLVYLFNLSFLALLIAGFWSPVLWACLLGLWIAKTVVEFPFLYSITTYFNRRSLLKYFLFFQPFHIAYTILAGWLGQFGKYEWKGRRVH